MDPPCGSKFIYIDIDFTKVGATAFIISFLRLRCGAHLIHQPTADSVVEPLTEDLIAFMSAYRDAMTKNIKTQILHKSCEKKIQKQKQKTSENQLHARKRRCGTHFPKIVKYKSLSRSKLNFKLTVLFSGGINRLQPNTVRLVSHFTHCPSRN